MATVHPSRMGLVPQDRPHRPTNERPRGRSPSPRGRHSHRSRSRSPPRSRSKDRDANARPKYDKDDRRDATNPHDRGYERRASPRYEDYRERQLRRESPAPNMYRNRGGGGGQSYGGGGGRPYGGGAGNSDWLDSRREQREAMTVNIWPPSPKEPQRSLSPKRKKSRKHKRARSPSTDSSEEDRRRRRKEKKRSRKEKEKDGKDRKRRHRSYSRSPSSSSSRARSRDGDRRHRHADKDRDAPVRPKYSRSRSKDPRPRSASRSPTRQPPRSLSPISSKDLQGTNVANRAASHSRSPCSPVPRATDKGKAKSQDLDSDSDGADVGPHPIYAAGTSKKLNERAYGGALLRGEGSAMAAFLQDDTGTRIPRRGEIGLSPDQIAEYETIGYVMSGSRHKRMNAVRMRKENQVISAEEKRSILKLQKEEKERREAILREEFSEIVSERLKAANMDVDLPSAPKPSSS